MADTSILNKAELCAVLGWGRPRLDRVLERDSNFPVRTRGNSPEGWTFSLPLVTQYLAAGGGKAKPGRRPKTKADEEAELAAAAPTAPTAPTAAAPAVHQGEATAKQRRDQASAQLLEDKLRRDRGELLERDDVRQVAAQTMAVFSRGLDILPEQIVKILGIEEKESERVREICNELRGKLVAELQPLLG
ncbi:MAG TPA: hypothetical protein VFA75_03205 [Nevskia sp.]|nr:hypothetical protein [Nevskia sp.]